MLKWCDVELVEGVSESALVLSAVSLPLIVSVFPRLSLFNDAVLKNLKNEFPQSKSSKRKDDIETKKKKPFQKDTTSYQIIKFVQAVMNVLDKHSKNEFYIVMDDCNIHHAAFLVESIIHRLCLIICLFQNPIEECWWLLELNILSYWARCIIKKIGLEKYASLFYICLFWKSVIMNLKRFTKEIYCVSFEL